MSRGAVVRIVEGKSRVEALFNRAGGGAAYRSQSYRSQRSHSVLLASLKNGHFLQTICGLRTYQITIICLPVSMNVCLYVGLSVFMSVFVSVCGSVSPSLCLSVCMSVFLSKVYLCSDGLNAILLPH